VGEEECACARAAIGESAARGGRGTADSAGSERQRVHSGGEKRTLSENDFGIDDYRGRIVFSGGGVGEGVIYGPSSVTTIRRRSVPLYLASVSTTSRIRDQIARTNTARTGLDGFTRLKALARARPFALSAATDRVSTLRWKNDPLPERIPQDPVYSLG